MPKAEPCLRMSSQLGVELPELPDMMFNLASADGTELSEWDLLGVFGASRD